MARNFHFFTLEGGGLCPPRRRGGNRKSPLFLYAGCGGGGGDDDLKWCWKLKPKPGEMGKETRCQDSGFFTGSMPVLIHVM